MKTSAGLVVIAMCSLGVAAATAKTVTADKTANERAAVGVAGPAPAGNKPKAASSLSSKQTPRKVKVKPSN